MYTSHEDIGYDFEDDPKDKKTLKPHPDIDGGWAWVMVLSSFFVHILIMGASLPGPRFTIPGARKTPMSQEPS